MKSPDCGLRLNTISNMLWMPPCVRCFKDDFFIFDPVELMNGWLNEEDVSAKFDDMLVGFVVFEMGCKIVKKYCY